MDLFKIFAPIEWVVAWIMYLAHSALTWIGLDPASGAAWGLSVVALVIVMRIILIPLFFKQIHAQRRMQMLTPELQVIQKNYKGKSDQASRAAISRETMALYEKHGTNPMSSCLPLLAQSPIFFALFQVLRGLAEIASGAQGPIGPIGQAVASQAERSQIFGAPLSSTFSSAALDPALATSTRVVTIALIVAMAATMFLTQRQLTMKNLPAAALEGQGAQTQKAMMYVMPLVMGFSGVGLPIGVLLYMTTTNIWSMGQQFYTIRRMPTPGSEAERQMQARQTRQGFGHDAGTGSVAETVDAESTAAPRVAKSRGKSKGPGTPRQGGPVGARRKRAGRTDVTAKQGGDAPQMASANPRSEGVRSRRHKTQPPGLPKTQGNPQAIS